MTRVWLGRFGVLLVMTICGLGGPGRAAEPHKHPARHTAQAPAVQRLGAAGTWTAYLYKDRSARVCYLAGGPQKAEPGKLKAKSPVAMVTHRPEENVANVVSFDIGIPLKEGSDAALEVDSAHFDLFTKGDTAWSRTSDLDRHIVEAMAKARQAVIKATPAKGPAVTDIYSLSGFAATLALIDKACGVKR